MIARVGSPPRRRRNGSFHRDQRGASAVEFAVVCGPFLAVVLYSLQIALYYFAQASIDAGVNQTADGLRNSFNYAAAPVLPQAAALKSLVATNAGRMIPGDATLSVEIRPLQSLSTAAVPITDGIADYGTTTSVLVLRAQSRGTSIAPNFPALAVVASTAIVRRNQR